jgi:hypothetical protein
MAKAIIISLVASLFFISCAKEQETAEQIDNRTHYLRAKQYYALYRLRGVEDLTQTDRELEWRLDKYLKTLRELDLAVFETTGAAREDVMDMIEECNDNVDSIRERLNRRARYGREYESRWRDSRHKRDWMRDEMRETGMDGIGSSQNEAIAESRAEMERMRRMREDLGDD